jgi:hypothetical protein
LQQTTTARSCVPICYAETMPYWKK